MYLHLSGILKFTVVAAVFATGLTPAHARDMFNFKEAALNIEVNEPLANDTEGYVSFTKSLPLERGGAELRVSVQMIKSNNYHMIEWITSGAPSLNRAGGLGYSMTLWPSSSVWSLQRESQAIYAAGNGVDGMMKDLAAKFNGTKGRVKFTSSGNLADGNLVIKMRNP